MSDVLALSIILGCGLLGFCIVYIVMTKTRVEANDSIPNEPKRHTTEEPIRQWHEILEIDTSATAAEIQIAYHKMINMYHPDRVDNLGRELKEMAEKKTKEINAAYTLAKRLRK
jgi:DnaJ-domain-containing protein 1